MKRLVLTILCVLLPAAALPAQETSFLPQSFDGWQLNPASLKLSHDPAAADPADAPVLKEYGLTDVELATYTRNGLQIKVKAARFKDATGGYGAFTYYVQPRMSNLKIADQGAYSDSRVLFYRGNILVDAALERVTAMSATDLRALSDGLPRLHGAESGLPSLPTNLPRQSYIPHTARYVVGPVALDRLGAPIPASMVDFGKGAEVELAKYNSSRGEANLTLISYPTPQIAGERMRAMESASFPAGPFYFKRTGPIVVAVNGEVPATEAQSLLASVNYDADLTWNQATKPNPRDNVATFIIEIFVLIGILLAVALVLGFAFGGLRVVAKRLFPGRFFDRPERVEIIQLNLK